MENFKRSQRFAVAGAIHAWDSALRLKERQSDGVFAYFSGAASRPVRVRDWRCPSERIMAVATETL